LFWKEKENRKNTSVVEKNPKEN